MTKKLYVGEQKQYYQGELNSNLKANIAANIKPEDIPVAVGVDVEAIKAGDDNPLEVAVSIPASRSTRKWYYTAESLKDIVDYVNENTLNGFLGHQKAEDVGNQFLPPVTHWVGATMQGETAYFRGVIDAAAEDLKRWIRSGRIKEVSIFGTPTLEKGKDGSINVVAYDPLSIDWTPLHRPGMKTEIVGLSGEMKLDGTIRKLEEALEKEIKERFKSKLNADNIWVWLKQINYKQNIVTAEVEESDTRKLYSMPFMLQDEELLLGEEIEVEERRVYEPVIEDELQGGNDEMGLEKESAEELLKALGKKVVAGEMSMEDVERELGVDNKPTNEEAEVLEQIKETLGISGEMEVVEVIEDYKKRMDKAANEEHKAIIDDLVKEEVSGEIAQELVKDMLDVEVGTPKEEITGEIAKILEKPSIKQVLSKSFIDKPAALGDQVGNEASGNVTRVKKSI